MGGKEAGPQRRIRAPPSPSEFCGTFWGKKKTNKHKEFWPGHPLVCVPSVLWKCPICPVICPVCPADVPPLELEFSHKSAQTSRVSLGRPEFVPGALPGHSDTKFLYVIFLYRFFSRQPWGSAGKFCGRFHMLKSL